MLFETDIEAMKYCYYVVQCKGSTELARAKSYHFIWLKTKICCQRENER